MLITIRVVVTAVQIRIAAIACLLIAAALIEIAGWLHREARVVMSFLKAGVAG